MKIVECQQGSVEWYKARLGLPTASQFHRIITKTARKSDQDIKYISRLVTEDCLRQTFDDHISYIEHVARGRANEPYAKAALQYLLKRDLEPVGFVLNDNETAGCSPDCLVKGVNEGVEIKCPTPPTLMHYHLFGLGDNYQAQVQGQILVAGFSAVHFFAWHPDMPPFHHVSEPDKDFQTALRQLLPKFIERLAKCKEIARALGHYEVHEFKLPIEKLYADADGPFYYD